MSVRTLQLEGLIREVETMHYPARTAAQLQRNLELTIRVGQLDHDSVTVTEATSAVARCAGRAMEARNLRHVGPNTRRRAEFGKLQGAAIRSLRVLLKAEKESKGGAS